MEFPEGVKVGTIHIPTGSDLVYVKDTNGTWSVHQACTEALKEELEKQKGFIDLGPETAIVIPNDGIVIDGLGESSPPSDLEGEKGVSDEINEEGG